jgi:hypothetical protein
VLDFDCLLICWRFCLPFRSCCCVFNHLFKYRNITNFAEGVKAFELLILLSLILLDILQYLFDRFLLQALSWRTHIRDLIFDEGISLIKTSLICLFALVMLPCFLNTWFTSGCVSTLYSLDTSFTLDWRLALTILLPDCIALRWCIFKEIVEHTQCWIRFQRCAVLAANFGSPNLPNMSQSDVS